MPTLGFLFGVLFGALGALVVARLVRRRRRRRSITPAGTTVPTVEGRAPSMTPESALLTEDTRELQAMMDVRFWSLGGELLDDIRSQHGAVAAAVWRMRDHVLDRDMTVGHVGAIDDLEEALLPLLKWSVRERIVQFGPDGDAPCAAVAPVGGQDVSGAIALVFREPFRGDRADLKRWLLRHGERFGLIGELVRTHGELAKMNRRTRVLLRETRNWDVEERPADLGARLCAMVEQLTGADGAALIRWDDDAQRGSVVVADGTCAQYAGSPVDEDSLAGTKCRENVPGLWHEVGGRGEAPEALFSRSLPTQTGCVLVQPLRRRGAVIGAVVATHREPGALGMAELRALSLFDAVASFRLASAWKVEELHRRALIDGLTGLTNRRGFEADMTAALGEQMRYGWEVSLILVDIDHFKDVNDTHGHEAGDMVLREVATILDDAVRTTDVCARVGGEEMALILKDTGGEGARELAERLRAAIAAKRFHTPSGDIAVTASFGVATYPTEVKEWDTLYGRADRALYEAKAMGRNQVRGLETQTK